MIVEDRIKWQNYFNIGFPNLLIWSNVSNYIYPYIFIGFIHIQVYKLSNLNIQYIQRLILLNLQLINQLNNCDSKNEKKYHTYQFSYTKSVGFPNGWLKSKRH